MADLTAADFQPYNPADADTIEAGPLALFTVSPNSILPTQQNEGFTEVDAKAAGYDLDTSLSEVESDLLGDVEPVVIGPGGQLYLLDGHHTFTALLDSVWGNNPNLTVYVNVIANFSNLTPSQFLTTMAANDFLLPLNDGVPEPVSDLPTSLTGLTSDVYRGLEYSILKNKSSKLFTTANNITGAVGASTPGLDKMPGLYSDFLEAAAYQGADGGLGLPYLSPGDIALATQWNLNPDSTTTLPNVSGTVFAYQLPGFILSQNITVSGVVSNATMNESGTTGMSLDPAGESQTGALDGNGTFTGVTQINAGTVADPILIGTPNTGFIMQLGNDKGFTVTLSNTANTYIGGTTILAGRLIIAGDGSLGAAPTESLTEFNDSLTFDNEGIADNVGPAVQADNGIIFNSLSEGNGTLTIGTTAGEYSSSNPFVTNRPIAVGNEAATIDVNGSTVDLDGPLVTLGYDELGIGETTGFPDLTIDDLSSGGGKTPTAGTLVLSTPSPYFYGDIIIGNVGTPTVEVMSDAALGNTTAIDGSTIPIGTVELNGGTLQTGASFNASERNITLDGGSQIDVDGNTTSWGTLTDVKRTIAIGNSNTTTAGSITFNNFVISQTSTLQLDGSANGTTYSGAETVTFTNGIDQTADTDTLFIAPSSAAALGTTEQVFSGDGASTLEDGGLMAPAWMITDSGGGASTNPYNFLTYGADGYVAVTYTDTGSGSTGGIRTATSASIVDQTGNATLAKNAQAFALKVNDGETITATGFTITLGDGTDPAGLIMDGGGATIAGGTLAFGGSQAIIYAKGSNTISSEITGTNGLTLAGSGTLTLSAAAPFTALSGPITIASGELSLTTANLFASDVAGLTLDDVKSSPSNSILNFTANQTFTTLNSIGTKSAITFSNGATLTIGDTTNNLSSTLSSSITETGNATAGALTINGTGLTDLSGMSGGTLSLVSGSTIVVENGAQLRVVASEFANGNFAVDLNGASTQLQFAQNGGGRFANAITGTGELHLIGGTLQLTEAAGANTYSGGTVVETGSTLDLTTNQVSTGNANITDAGGLIVFDQDFGGVYSGVISNGLEMGTGPMLAGSLDIDDSAADSANSNDVTLTAVQTYTGATYVEAGTLTLGVANALADSSGVTLGRVGGAVSGFVGGGTSGTPYTQTASLVLDADEQLNSLNSNAGNSTFVVLNGNTLTLTPSSVTQSNFGGIVSDGTTPGGNVVVDGAGTVTFTGDNTYSGGTTIDAGTFELGNVGAAGTGAITFGANADATLKIELGDAPTNPGNIVENFMAGDSIDFAGVGLETSYTYSDGVLQLTGGSSSAQIDIAAPPPGEFFALSSDGNGGTLVTLDSTVPTESVNGPYSGNENAPIPLDLSVTATPNTNDPLTTTLSVSNGTLTVGTTGGASITGNGTDQVILSGTAAQINSALGGANYTGDTNFYGSDTLSMTITDTTDEQSSGTQTVAITVNDTTAPSESVGGPYSGNENTPIALSLSVSASPNANDPLSTTLSVSNGTITAGGDTGSSITLTGTAAQIDAALAGATYTGNANYYGPDTLSMTTTDTADSQTTGAETATITVADTATITDSGVTGGFSGTENTPISLAGISVSDSNTGDASLVTTLSVNDGIISVGATTNGATVGTNNSGTVTLTGTAAEIDASLQNTSYTGDTNFYGFDTLSVTSTDGGGRTSGTSQGIITVDDTTAPSESVGGPYSGNENTPIALSLSVSASPNTNDPLTTTLSVGDGTITVGTTGGATVLHNGTGSVTLSGTAAQIDSALQSASYTGNTNFYGSDTLSMTTTDTVDNQSTGAETASITLADTATVAEHVGGPYSGNENTPIALSLSVSANPNANDPLTTTLSVGDGTITVGTTGGATVLHNGSGSVTLSGTAAQIDSALESASYTGNTNFYGSDTLSMTTTDTADSQTTGAETAKITVADTATITETLPASLTGVWGTPISLVGISVADNPNTGDTLTTVLKVANGTITIGSGSGATVKGNGTGAVTLIGTEATIDAALSMADYTANASSPGTDTLSVTTTDPDGHSSGAKTVAITSNLPSAPDLGLGLGAGPSGSLNVTNTTDPEFGGVAQPFSLILIYDGNTVEGIGYANAQGQWTATGFGSLPLGDQEITARAYTPQGDVVTSAATTVDVVKGTNFGSATTTQNVNFQAGDGNNTMQWENGVGVVIAGDGNNKITAGNGMDTVQLGNGNNVASLGNGNDSVTAGNGMNTVTLGNGNDAVTLGYDVIDGFWGFDTNYNYFGFGLDSGSNTVNVGNGNDTISIGGADNTLVLGSGDDTISLGGGDNTITLGTGAYAITTQSSAAQSSFYNGGDTIILMAPPQQLTLAFNTGDKLVFANTGFDLGVDDGKGTATPQQIAASLFSTSSNGTFTNTSQRFAYDQATGDLYYDAEGDKAGSTVQLVAHFSNDPHLTAANLYFIS